MWQSKMKKCVVLPTSSLSMNEQRLGIGSTFTHLRMCPEKCRLESDHRTPRYLAKYYFWVCLWGCFQKTLVFELESRVTECPPLYGRLHPIPWGPEWDKREGRLALSGWPLSWDFSRLPSRLQAGTEICTISSPESPVWRRQIVGWGIITWANSS